MKTKLENNMEEIFELPSSPPISDEIMEVLPYQEDDTVDTDIE